LLLLVLLLLLLLLLLLPTVSFFFRPPAPPPPPPPRAEAQQKHAKKHPTQHPQQSTSIWYQIDGTAALFRFATTFRFASRAMYVLKNGLPISTAFSASRVRNMSFFKLSQSQSQSQLI
jgi:hypothetical protein